MIGNRGLVLLDPRLAVLPLFRERSRSSAPAPVDLVSETRGSIYLVSGEETVDGTDQSVMYAVHRLVMATTEVAEARSSDAELQALWHQLEVDDLRADGWSATAAASWRGLAQLAGLAGSGPPVRCILERSLQRLAAITVERRAGGLATGSRLLSFHATSDGLRVALNPSCSLVARGVPLPSGRTRRYVSLSLDERYSLADPAARVAHAWLRAWSSSKKAERKISLDRLMSNVWSDDCRRSTRGRRRTRLLAAIEAIKALPGWSIERGGSLCVLARSAAGA